MIVQCPKCSARFRLDSNRVSDRGTKVACSNCGNQFTVRPIDDIADPFAITNVDLKPLPAMKREPVPSVIPDNPFSNDAVRTAVHKVPDVTRMRSPATLDEASTLVELPSSPTPVNFGANLAVTATHSAYNGPSYSRQSLGGDDDLAVDDGDLMSLDDSEVMAMEDEPTVSPGGAPVPSFARYEPTPTPMPPESSRSETAIAHIPSLAPAPRHEESAVHRLHAFDRTASSSFADLPATEQPGLKTFVGHVDAATLAAASQTSELDLRGGLSADGSYTPPVQEPTRTQPLDFGLARDPLDINDKQGFDAARRATRQVPPMSGADLDDRRTGRGTVPAEVTRSARVMRALMTVALSLVLAGLAVYALIRSGQLDLAVLRDPSRVVRNSDKVGGEGVSGVTPVAVQSIVYPTVNGGSVLVFTGDVLNSGASEARNLDVIAEVRDRDGSVRASERGPLGVVLDVSELARLTDAASVRAAFAAKATGVNTVVAPGGRASYMVVISPVPEQYRYYRHQVRLAQRAAGESAAAPAPVKAAPDASAEAAAPQDSAPAPAMAADDDVAQRKAKLKAKRAKMKRRARDAEEASATDE